MYLNSVLASLEHFGGEQERNALAHLLVFAQRDSKALAEIITRLDRIEGEIKQMDSRLTDILALGTKQGTDLDTIKGDLTALETEDAALKAQLAQTDPADSAAIDTIKTQLTANQAKTADILATFAPATPPVTGAAPLS